MNEWTYDGRLIRGNDLPRLVVLAVLEDLHGRSGLGLDQVDADVRIQMVDELVELVSPMLQPAAPAAEPGRWGENDE